MPFLLGQAQGGLVEQLMGMVVPLGFIFIIFYFLLWRPQSKAAQTHQAFLNALKVGDEVVTSSGVFGKISAIDEKTVTLEVSRGTKIRLLRQQIQGSQDSVLGKNTEDDKT